MKFSALSKKIGAATGVATLSVLVPGLAMAGGNTGSITFSPVPPATIPTMGGIGLLILAVILGGIAVRALKSKAAPNHLASFFTLGITGLLCAAGGIGLMSDSRAEVVLTEQDISNPEGETFGLTSGQFYRFINTTGVTMGVTDIQDPLCGVGDGPPDPDPTCELGLNLANGEKCTYVCESLAISDRRLKTDITQVSVTDSGLPLYTFRYIGDAGLYQGVMAQDVLQHSPAAVVVMPDGYYAVNYGALGTAMQRIQ